MDWMAVSSYGSGTQSSGVVRILKDLDTDITGSHVLVVEDIVDSGLTLSWLVGNLRVARPGLGGGLRHAAQARGGHGWMWTSPTPGSTSRTSSSIGYGLDYAERYRNLPFIGTLAPHVYEGEEPSGAGGCHARARRRSAAGAGGREQDRRQER